MSQKLTQTEIENLSDAEFKAYFARMGEEFLAGLLDTCDTTYIRDILNQLPVEHDEACLICAKGEK